MNLALALLDMAYKDEYDHAFILSRDSDLAPAIHKVKQNFPRKMVSIFAPFNYFHSAELIKDADDNKTIKLKHISSCLFPAHIWEPRGRTAFRIHTSNAIILALYTTVQKYKSEKSLLK